VATSEAARQLLPFLRILEHGSTQHGVVGDDALVDAWFGTAPPSCAPTGTDLPSAWPELLQHVRAGCSGRC
jgi:hypothetical protein